MSSAQLRTPHSTRANTRLQQTRANARLQQTLENNHHHLSVSKLGETTSPSGWKQFDFESEASEAGKKIQFNNISSNQSQTLSLLNICDKVGTVASNDKTAVKKDVQEFASPLFLCAFHLNFAHLSQFLKHAFF